MRPVAALALVLALACTSRAPTRAPRPPKPLSADAYAHYLRGRVAAYEGDYPRAARELAAAARTAPDEAPIRVALVEALYRAGRRAEARRQIESAQVRWPDDVGVWLMSGRVQRGHRNFAAAARAYQRAVELDPDEETAYLGLAGTWIALERPDRAESTYRALIAAQPESVIGHYRLGLRLLERGMPSAAEAMLRRTLDLDPGHVKAHVALARAQRKQGQHADATATLRRAFDRSNGDPRVGRDLFIQLLEIGDRRGAVELIGLIDRDDLEVDTRVSFGYLYLRVGEIRRALALASALAERFPDSDVVTVLRADALLSSGRRRAAVDVLMQVPPGRPLHARARARCAELLAADGHRERAAELIAEAAELTPHSIEVLRARARIDELGGDTEKARHLLRTAIRDRDDDVELRYALADLEERSGHPERGVALIEDLLARNPDDADAMNYIGYSLADRNVDLQRARALLRRALELDPDNGYVLDSWGWLLFRLERYDEAAAALERAARLAPAEPEILWHLGELYLAEGHRDRGLRLLERARRFAVDTSIRARIETRLAALRESS